MNSAAGERVAELAGWVWAVAVTVALATACVLVGGRGGGGGLAAKMPRLHMTFSA